jgi:hypothetical protein
MTLLDPVIHYLLTCGKKTVTLQAVVNGAQRTRKQVLRALDKLTREGYLVQISDNPETPGYRESGPPRRNPTWKITGELNARPQPNPPRKRSLRSKVWRAIRAKRCFTKKDLVITSGATAPTVDEYVRHLEKHGYVRKSRDLTSKICRDNGSILYQLVNLKQVEPPAGLFGGKS